jgi:potassium-dependent mechanosensitive channel
MRRLCLLVALVLTTALASVSLVAARAPTVEEQQRITSANAAVSRIMEQSIKAAEDFEALSVLRQGAEDTRNDLRILTQGLQARLATVKARLAELGPAPAAGAQSEDASLSFDRRRQNGYLTELEAGLKGASAALAQAEQLWDDLTDRRRKLFTSRLLVHQDSILSPAFWTRVIGEGLPQLSRRSARKAAEISEGLSQKQGWSFLGALFALMLVTGGVVLSIHRWLMRRRGESEAVVQASPTEAQIVARAAVVLTMRALPFLLIATTIWFAMQRFDVLPVDVEVFLNGFAGVLVAFGLGSGAVQAAFAPKRSAYRIIRTDDATAIKAVRTMNVVLLIYLGGMVLHGIEQMLSVVIILTVATTGLIALGIVIAAVLLARDGGRSDEQVSVHGIVQLPLHLLRPTLWLTGIVVIGALLFGYIALAGFITGRVVASAVILCLAALAYVAIETVFHDAVEPGKPANVRLVAALGLRAETIDLVGTIIAGILRVVIVVLTLVILFSPWGLEFGNKNPFSDVLFGVRFKDLRFAVGAAGIALILFGAGLIATRLFVSWLDNRLLPRTKLDTGVRHSVSTIAGYIGFGIALAVALGQAGVEVQNIALVAGALSVGIGFGLQQVVSNFVAGLIVLAERPIRVGDVVSVKGEEGKVKRISVRSTELALGEKSTLIVPNADFISSIVKNRSLVDPTQRIRVVMTLEHDADVKSAIDILLGAAQTNRHLQPETKPTVQINKVAESGIELELRYICDHLDNIDVSRTLAIYVALEKFKVAGVKLSQAS